MGLTLIKSISACVLGIPIVVYMALILGHILIEFRFNDSTLHEHLLLVETLPGVKLVSDSEDTLICLDEAIDGKVIGVSKWYKIVCDTEPATSITIHSRYMRKYWALYIDGNEKVRFKRSWVTM
jgi:hypothetical protein